jgi:hypothetical protein
LPLREIDPLTGPVYGGSAKVTGAGDTRFWISPLTRDYVALELDANSDGTPDRTLSFRWDNEFQVPASNRTGPLAISGPDLWESADIPGPLRLEGRFSENSAGVFLSHHWSLALAPPGSTATISAANTSRATFRPDQNGMYLFRLDVSDGTKTSIDYVTVRAFGFAGVEQLAVSGNNFAFSSNRRTARVVLEPDIVMVDGSVIALDGRRSYTPDGTPVQNSHWNVVASSVGGHTTILNVNQDPVQVTGAGNLLAGFTTMREFSGNLPSAGNLAIVAPTNRRMAPTVELPSLVAGSGSDGSVARATGDFNADGIEDVVLQRADFDANVRRLRVVLGTADGHLRQFGAELSVPNAQSSIDLPHAAVADINGDQRPDLLVAARGEVGYFLQSGVAGAPFGNYQAAASGCNGNSSMLQVADADGDGDVDVFARDFCAARGITLFRNNGGSLAAGVAVDLSGTTQQMDKFVVIDLNGDSKADIIARSLVGNATSWLAAPASGSYVPGQPVPAQFLFSSDFTLHGPVVTDLDGNGRPDAFIAGSTVQILWQAADGTLGHESLGMSGSPGAGSIHAVRDFDGDGLLDLLCGNGWYRQASGRLFAWQYYARGGAQQVGDVNGDSLVDLIDGPYITLQSPIGP